MIDTLAQLASWSWVAIQCVIAFYLLLPGILLAIHGLRSLFGAGGRMPKKKVEKDFDFAAIVTAHKDARFIAPMVDAMERQTYGKFMLYVVADDCDISGLSFQDERVVLLRPEPALHAKVRSIKYAMERFRRAHDVVVIFDSDNLVHPKYFEVLNGYFQAGYRSVQTHMLSKNLDSVYARLDSMGNVYNTFVEREARMDIGISSSILGLGIAVDTALYGKVLYEDNLGGFDKKLQSFLVRNGRIAFAPEAYVYDEKVDDGAALEKQRTRWIFAYFRYFAINWGIIREGIRSFRPDWVLFGINVVKPPLFLMLSAGLLCLVVDLFWMPGWALAWVGILCFFALSFILIVAFKSRQKGVASSIFYAPMFVFRQFRAMLGVKKASKDFMKTEHDQVIYINDILKHGDH